MEVWLKEYPLALWSEGNPDANLTDQKIAVWKDKIFLLFSELKSVDYYFKIKLGSQRAMLTELQGDYG